MKTLIVYYSMSGNTEYAARRVAERIGAELLPVRPETAYPDKGFAKFYHGGKSAVLGQNPRLQPCVFDAGRFDRVIFGFPVWAGRVAPPIRSFIAEHGEALKGKRLAAIACQSGNGAEKSLRRLCRLLGAEALEAELILIDPKARPSAQNEERLAGFCEKLE